MRAEVEKPGLLSTDGMPEYGAGPVNFKARRSDRNKRGRGNRVFPRGPQNMWRGIRNAEGQERI
ncbi:MAG: hypothetical protein DRH56_00895 [Deltaproteobacteria bacterium]|nr:MAG: hypothetical protein DRH56_00895 [Deltaproteobacteria bacterium]